MLADMIEGVVITNRLRAPEADRLRNELWREVESNEIRSTTDGRGVA